MNTYTYIPTPQASLLTPTQVPTPQNFSGEVYGFIRIYQDHTAVDQTL